jgi:probable HAF family extracellular repeat protein
MRRSECVSVSVTAGIIAHTPFEKWGISLFFPYWHTGVTLVHTARLKRALLLLIAAPLCGAPVYSIVNLGGLGEARSEAFTVNADGVAAGVASRPGQAAGLPVLYDTSGQPKTLSSHSGQVNGLNSSGTAVGTTFRPSGARATVWTEKGEELLPTFGGTESYALAINNAGNIVGSATDTEGVAHAFLSAGDVLQDLGELGGGWSSAYGVNDSLDVVGYSLDPNGMFRAFVWRPGSGMRALPTLGGANSYAFGVNAGGSIVGAANTLNGLNRAYIYRDGRMQDLGTLGGSISLAYGVNSSDQAVGYSMDSTGRMHAFIWMNGMMYDLNALAGNSEDWVFEAAYAINDSGQIAGTGSYRGVASAFRLDPVVVEPFAARTFRSDLAISDSAVPEPSSGGLLLVGALFVLVMVRSTSTFWRYASKQTS